MHHKQESDAMVDCIFKETPSSTRNALRKTAAGWHKPRSARAMPRRHPAGNDCFLDGLGPRSCIGITQQGHRADFARAMALLAMLLQDRCDVFGEGWSLGDRKTSGYENQSNDAHIRYRRCSQATMPNGLVSTLARAAKPSQETAIARYNNS